MTLLCCRKIYELKAFKNRHCFLLVSCRGKKDPANIRMQNAVDMPNCHHLQHILRLVEEERLHDKTVESEPSMSATPSPSPPLPPPLPQSMSSPRAVRRPTMDNRQADSPPRAAIAEPGARRKSGRGASAGIAHRPLLAVQDGEVRAAE